MMKCEFTVKVSEMLDGELPEEEAVEIAAHIETCDECNAAKEDFNFLRREIRGLMVDRVTSAAATPVFRRRISIPVPAMAAALVIVIVLAGALVFRTAIPKNTARFEAKRSNASASGGTLARFDGGGKALIYKEAGR